MKKMKSSDETKSCGYKYKCPDGIHICQTRCYLFDTNAILILAPEFINEKDLEEKKYSQVIDNKNSSPFPNYVSKFKFY